MAFETDLIRRYSGAFTREDCEKMRAVPFYEHQQCDYRGRILEF